MVCRHIARGRVLLLRQREILIEMRANGHSTVMAEELLTEMEVSQRLHDEHLTRLDAIIDVELP